MSIPPEITPPEGYILPSNLTPSNTGNYVPPGTVPPPPPGPVTVPPPPTPPDPTIPQGHTDKLGPDTVTPTDPIRAQRSLNGSLYYTYKGANQTYRIRVVGVEHEIHPIYETGEARQRRAFYPHAATIGQFSITIASNGYREKERLMRWLTHYSELLLGDDALGAGATFPPMTIAVPGLKFNRQGVPIQGVEFGNKVAALVWNTTIIFGPAQDPYDVNLENLKPSYLDPGTAKAAYAVDLNIRYFYPESPHITDWGAKDEYEKLTDLGQLQNIVAQRTPLPAIQNLGWPASAGKFGTGGVIAPAGGGTTTVTPGTTTTPTPGGTTPPGSTPDMANIYKDSTSVACDPRTTDRGVQDGYHGGVKIPIRICELPNIPGNGDGGHGGATVNSRVSTSMYNMAEAAKGNGVQLRSNSSFRTMAHQTYLYQHPQAPTARPGYSNHQMGLAIDYSNCSHGSATFTWLSGHAGGFHIINLPSESWHWSIDGG